MPRVKQSGPPAAGNVVNYYWILCPCLMSNIDYVNNLPTVRHRFEKNENVGCLAKGGWKIKQNVMKTLPHNQRSPYGIH